MKLPLCYYGNPILRKKCRPVDQFNDEIKQLVKDMEETMFMHDGIGLAAPQIGRDIALFIVNVPADLEEHQEGQERGDKAETTPSVTHVFINPKIVEHSEQAWVRGEGCLSIPKVYGEVTRPLTIKIAALDINGKPFTAEYTGLFARAVMHENDHINGVLFIDRIHGPARKELEPKLRDIKKTHH